MSRLVVQLGRRAVLVPRSTLCSSSQPRLFATAAGAKDVDNPTSSATKTPKAPSSKETTLAFKEPKAQKHASGDRDVTKAKTENSMVSLLRRVADSLEAGKSFHIQVKNEKLVVPEDAKVSVEHEKKGNEHELELQFKWTVK